MLSILAGITVFLAIGNLVAYTIILTLSWLINKIKQKFEDKKTKKLAVAELDKLIQSCSNRISLEQLEQLNEVSNEGYTHLMATVDDSGIVNDVEVIKDINESLDEEVVRFINKNNEGMVVIER